MLVHSSKWNRLDICDPWTDELLTEREFPVYEKGVPRPPHYLDYFHGSLFVSPDQKWIADDGWAWGAAGIPAVWNLDRWLTDNAWESEDGETKHSLPYRGSFWGGPTCWINEQTVAIWGYGMDDEWLIPAVRLFDVISGHEKSWFPGPEISSGEGLKWPITIAQRRSALVFDKYLFSISAPMGMQIWDIETGDRLLSDATFSPRRYHRATKEFLTVLPSGTLQMSRLIGDSPG